MKLDAECTEDGRLERRSVDTEYIDHENNESMIRKQSDELSEMTLDAHECTEYK